MSISHIQNDPWKQNYPLENRAHHFLNKDNSVVDRRWNLDKVIQDPHLTESLKKIS